MGRTGVGGAYNMTDALVVFSFSHQLSLSRTLPFISSLCEMCVHFYT